MLEKEYRYYRRHRKELVEKYNNKYIVIVGKMVVGSYDSTKEAFDASAKVFKLGTFMIQLSSPKEEVHRIY